MACKAPVDWSCADSNWVNGLDDDLVLRSEEFAWGVLRTLTGGAVSPCPVAIRPCRKGCVSETWTEAVEGVYGNGILNPHITAKGQWVNSCTCGGGDSCSCGPICEIVLPGIVGRIASVEIDGVTLPASAYRVDNGNRLVRQDGLCWPECQDMNAPAGAPNTFVVYAYFGEGPSMISAYAAGLLATEFAKLCTTGKCALPSGVTSLTRQGVSMEITTGMFVNGATGIRAVDAFIAMVNPYGLRQPPRVASPDLRRGRITTVPSAPFQSPKKKVP